MKNNLKSVRLSDEVFGIVQSYRGEGFNEKFENIVIDFKKTLPEREAYKVGLDEIIGSQKKKLAGLLEAIRKVEKIESAVERCLCDLESAVGE